MDLDPDTDQNPYRNIGKTCLDGSMHCPIWNSLSNHAVSAETVNTLKIA